MTADNPPLEVPSLCDRQEIIDTTTRLCMHADFHDWTGLRSCFADDLTVHFPGVTGGESREIAADDFVARWKRYLSRFESTQHLSTNHLVAGDDNGATCQTYFQTQYYRPATNGGGFWTVGGHYEFDFRRTEDRWNITAFVVTPLWTSGNKHLHELAVEQADTNEGR